MTTNKPPVELTTLDNGLTVVSVPDHVAPLVAVNIWYQVGSRDEEAGRTGFAHLFEHLMFQGSSSVARGEFDTLVNSVGGSMNGTTSFDRTNYFETLPKHATELALWLEADRMATLPAALDQANLDNQRDVVKNERRQRYDNVPYGTAWEELVAMSFPAGHPYHHMPIGSMQDLDAASLEDVLAFFHKHYSPANAVLTLAGDITSERALDLARTYFGGIVAQPAPMRKHVQPLRAFDAALRHEVSADVPFDRAYHAWRVEPQPSRSAMALTLALSVLGDGSTSRLEQVMVRRDEAAHGVFASRMGLAAGTDLAVIGVTAAPGNSLSALEATLDFELARLADQGPETGELELAQARFERQVLGSLTSVEDVADQVGRAASLFGNPTEPWETADLARSITPDEVRVAAAALLSPRASLNFTKES